MSTDSDITFILGCIPTLSRNVDSSAKSGSASGATSPKKHPPLVQKRLFLCFRPWRAFRCQNPVCLPSPLTTPKPCSSDTTSARRTKAGAARDWSRPGEWTFVCDVHPHSHRSPSIRSDDDDDDDSRLAQPSSAASHHQLCPSFFHLLATARVLRVPCQSADPSPAASPIRDATVPITNSIHIDRRSCGSDVVDAPQLHPSPVVVRARAARVLVRVVR